MVIKMFSYKAWCKWNSARSIALFLICTTRTYHSRMYTKHLKFCDETSKLEEKMLCKKYGDCVADIKSNQLTRCLTRSVGRALGVRARSNIRFGCVFYWHFQNPFKKFFSLSFLLLTLCAFLTHTHTDIKWTMAQHSHAIWREPEKIICVNSNFHRALVK